MEHLKTLSHGIEFSRKRTAKNLNIFYPNSTLAIKTNPQFLILLKIQSNLNFSFVFPGNQTENLNLSTRVLDGQKKGLGIWVKFHACYETHP